jgi:hypothetical protein
MTLEKPSDFNWENIGQIFLASSLDESKQMKVEGKDPIIVRISPNEVCVLTKSQDIITRIREGNNWNMGQDGLNEDGYFEYIYTRLNEQELIEHLNNPSKFKGSDQ